jgi:hypothetical protein
LADTENPDSAAKVAFTGSSSISLTERDRQEPDAR